MRLSSRDLLLALVASGLLAAPVALLRADAPTLAGAQAATDMPTPADASNARTESALPADPVVPAAAPLPPRAVPGASYRSGRAAFSIRVGGLPVPLRTLGIPVEPGATVEIEGPGSNAAGLDARAGGGVIEPAGRERWLWKAPRRGNHTVEVTSAALQDTIRVTFLVMRPATDIRDGVLGGYRIGSYRPRPAGMSASYEPPTGFVEVRPEDHDILVAPNFRLGQFLCKQEGELRFVVVSPALLLKLEALLAQVNAAGHAAPSLSVMSGFRTPAYNRAIGNTTDFSRHLWGDAADVFVDADGDGLMDDLNGDGRVSSADARWLADRMDDVMAEPEHGLVPGGLSVYRANAAHGPFVHVDARGHPARW